MREARRTRIAILLCVLAIGAFPSPGIADWPGSQLLEWCGKDSKSAEYGGCFIYLAAYIESQDHGATAAAMLSAEAAEAAQCKEAFQSAVSSLRPIRRELWPDNPFTPEERGKLTFRQQGWVDYYRFCIPSGVTIPEVAAALRGHCLGEGAKCGAGSLEASYMLELALPQLYPCFETSEKKPAAPSSASREHK